MVETDQREERGDGENRDRNWVIHGREENMTIHDEGGMRHFYAEWSRRMGRPSSAPFDEMKADLAPIAAVR